jgi:FkbH-like protein
MLQTTDNGAGPSLFQVVSDLRKRGKTDAALLRLRDALRRGQLDAEEVDRAGRLIRKELNRPEASRPDVRLLLLGQCTTSWLATALTAVGWGRGGAVAVAEGEYDNVLQELMAPELRGSKPDVVVLLPWNQRLLSGDARRVPQRRIDEEVAFWERAWALIAQRYGARIVQVGYDWMLPGALGQHLGGAGDGDLAVVRRTNEALRSAIPVDSYFLDLEGVAGVVGRERFYDPRRYFWTKQPFSEHGTLRLAEHLWAGVRAVTTGPKKVLALDLDNTLWGGVVGETGPLGIALGETPDGEAYLAFQRHIKELARRGIVLAVCSKNNPEDARAAFATNTNMVLALDDFARFEASWHHKPAVLARIAEALRLGLDSFVFFDDNAAEREHVRRALPEVEVVEVPADPAEYVRALQAGHWFESVTLTRADEERTQQYQQENARAHLQQASESLEDYLRSLMMRAEVRPIDDADFPRVVQLIGKTNQFNLTTRRHGTAEVRRLLATPGAIGLTLRVGDRFGDHGLMAVLLAEPTGAEPTSTLRIDTWLMSCRVINRTVEQYLFNALVERSLAMGYRDLIGEYIPTPKNAPTADLYDRLGFERDPTSEPDLVRYRLALDHAEEAETFVRDAS